MKNIIKCIKISMLLTIVVYSNVVCAIELFKTDCSNDAINKALELKEFDLIKSCVKVSPYALGVLGDLYLNGNGLQEDRRLGVKLLEEAAEKGDMDSIMKIAYAYYNSVGVKQDYLSAIKWYGTAVEKGNVEAMTLLSDTYYQIKDYKNSQKWLLEAYNAGDATAKIRLGNCYLEGGRGLQKDCDKAIQIFQEAGEKGNSLGFIQIAEMYEFGNCVKQSYLKADDWYFKARELNEGYGSGFARKALSHNPTPFDLEITKSTITDFKRRFPKHKESKLYTNITKGKTYLVNNQYAGLENVKENIAFIFNDNEILEAVLIFFDKSEFSKLSEVLKDKYKFNRSSGEGVDLYDIGRTYVALFNHYHNLFYNEPSNNFLTPRARYCTLQYQSNNFYKLMRNHEEKLEELKLSKHKKTL